MQHLEAWDVVEKLERLLPTFGHRIRLLVRKHRLLSYGYSLLTFLLENVLASAPEEEINATSLATWIRQDDTLIEVGARTGGLTCLLSRLVGRGGFVLCFEPNPFCIATLNRRTRSLANVKVMNVAALDEDSVLQLNFDYLYDPKASLSKNIGLFRRTIRSARIDGVVENLGIRKVDVLIIDAEGSEDRILIGAVNALKEVRTVYVEVHHFLDQEIERRLNSLLHRMNFVLVDKKIQSVSPLISTNIYMRINKIKNANVAEIYRTNIDYL